VIVASIGTARPQVTFWQIWNMCFGFLGIQFGFALQNANTSRIFQSLGAKIEDIPILWIAAPLTGLLVQPVIGFMSDRTWNWLGRRRPYFLAGALLASAALIFMPRSPTLWIAAGVLWVLDASINISMEPFRAFVADQMPPKQRPTGYAMQSFFIGAGAVVASVLPWVFTQLGVSNESSVAQPIPDSVRYAFDVGAVVLLGAMLWTVLTTREFPPEKLHGFADATALSETIAPGNAQRVGTRGLVWMLVGAIGTLAVWRFGIAKDLYVVTGGFTAWGLLLMASGAMTNSNTFTTLMRDIDEMPPRMRELVPVQFFSWFGMFAMWTQMTPTVTQHFYGTTDALSNAFNEGSNWVGILSGAQNACTALAAAVIPFMVRRLGLQRAHLANLWVGGFAFLSFLVIPDPQLLIVPMIAIGFTWASIVSLPYALLANSVPSRKMGVYMGIFNFFIVIPQLVAASVLGPLIASAFGGRPIYAIALGGVSFLIAGVLALRVK
jgi:maltose/moltooligosaccharide transporter